LWFLLYRIKHSGVPRENQYFMAIKSALDRNDEFNGFVADYINYINGHRDRIMRAGEIFLTERLDNDMDDFLAEQIFSLF